MNTFYLLIILIGYDAMVIEVDSQQVCVELRNYARAELAKTRAGLKDYSVTCHRKLGGQAVGS